MLSRSWSRADTMDLLTLHDQVFLLLVAEMALFMLLVVPMPFTVKRKMFTYVIPTHRIRKPERCPSQSSLRPRACMACMYRRPSLTFSIF